MRRKAVGFSQEALAALLDVERSTVVRWESGETNPLPWIRPKLDRALGVSTDQLDALLKKQRRNGWQRSMREPGRLARRPQCPCQQPT